MKSVTKIIKLSIYLSLCFCLSVFDKMITSFIIPAFPGIRLGLSNLVMVFVVFEFSFTESLFFMIAKALLTTLPSGVITFFIGAPATAISFMMMVLVKNTLKTKVSAIGVSTTGGVFHIIIQLLIVSLIYKSFEIFKYYGLVLFLISVLTSTFIGVLSNKLINIFTKRSDMYTDIYQKILAYDTIIIHRHKNPDGDAYGSQLGLKKALQDTFSKKRILACGTESSHFSFLGKMDAVFEKDYENALVIVTDTGAKHLIDGDVSKSKFLIKIDHHNPDDAYGDINLVLPSVISASLIVANMLLEKNFKISKEAATALLTGIITDSGRFMYKGVDADTLFVSGKLLELGADLDYIYKNLYNEDLNLKRLKAAMTLKFNLEGNVAYLINSYEEVEKSGFDFFTISRGMVGVMSGISQIDFWANFTENAEGKIIAELRSKEKPIVEIAKAFGGGGHELACGATLNSRDDIKKVIERLKKIND